MECSFSLLIFVFVSTIQIVYSGSLIIPPENTNNQYFPICTSYSGLCNIAYNVYNTTTHRRHVLYSHAQVCRCPGSRACPVDWNIMDNSIIKVFKLGGVEMEVKISYCHLVQPDEICSFNRPAVVLRGDGIFNFEVFGDFRCKCNRRLYAHSSWREGDYNYVEYSCGKPRCIMNHTDNTCMRLTYQPTENNILTEHRCRCRRFEECVEQRPPTPENPIILQTCQPFSTTRR